LLGQQCFDEVANLGQRNLVESGVAEERPDVQPQVVPVADERRGLEPPELLSDDEIIVFPLRQELIVMPFRVNRYLPLRRSHSRCASTCLAS